MKTFRPKKSDVFFWHVAVAHDGRKISQDRTRKNIVTHFCPTTVVPNYFERHSDNAHFSSSVYDEVII